jgi:hypothetical protein
LKFIIEIAQGASFFTRTAWKRVLESCGHEVVLWEPEKIAAHDIFNKVGQVDIAILNSYSVNRALYSIIRSRSDMKVALYGSCFGPICDDIDIKKYPIVVVGEEEKKWMAKLYDRISFIFLHCTPNSLEYTMSWWAGIGLKPVSIMNGADLFVYHNAQPEPKYMSAVGYCGGYWPYKGQRLNEFIVRYANEHVLDRNIKVFGFGDWGISQYLGSVNFGEDAKIFASSHINPSISEAHSIELFGDIIERNFKIPIANGFLISDNVKDLEHVFHNKEVPTFSSYTEFHDLIEYYILPENNLLRLGLMQRQKQVIWDNHTYFERVSDMLRNFGETLYADKVLEKKQELFSL